MSTSGCTRNIQTITRPTLSQLFSLKFGEPYVVQERRPPDLATPSFERVSRAGVTLA